MNPNTLTQAFNLYRTETLETDSPIKALDVVRAAYGEDYATEVWEIALLEYWIREGILTNGADTRTPLEHACTTYAHDGDSQTPIAPDDTNTYRAA